MSSIDIFFWVLMTIGAALSMLGLSLAIDINRDINREQRAAALTRFKAKGEL